MKPTRAQTFLASPWLGRIWFTVLPLSLAIGVGRFCADFLNPLAAWPDFLRFSWYVFLGFLLGLLLAIFPGFLFIAPFYYGRELKNGGPFNIGDMVQILSGPHKGRIARIYSTWQRGTVRVELGEEEKEKFKDIFGPAQLLMEKRAEPTPSGA